MTPSCNVAFQKISHKQAVSVKPSETPVSTMLAWRQSKQEKEGVEKKGRKSLFNASQLQYNNVFELVSFLVCFNCLFQILNRLQWLVSSRQFASTSNWLKHSPNIMRCSLCNSQYSRVELQKLDRSSKENLAILKPFFYDDQCPQTHQLYNE